MAAALNKSRRFMRPMTISSVRVTPGGSSRHFKAREVHADLMLALAHANRCRPKGATLKSGNDLFRVAGSIDKNHRYSTRLERFHGARADSAAQHGLAIPQRIDKP
jgi:hypothetical protein